MGAKLIAAIDVAHAGSDMAINGNHAQADAARKDR